MSDRKAILALADGTVFEGRAIGAQGETTGEVVFNTALTGYQEILSDPSYAGQIVTLTYPEIGNYGTNAVDAEAERIHAAGLVAREICERPSNWRSEASLGAWLAAQGVVGIAGIDTRMLVRRLTRGGAQMAVLTTDLGDPAALVEKARGLRGMEGRDLASTVSTREAYTWAEGLPREFEVPGVEPPGGRYRVVVYDFGVKRSILRLLYHAGCELRVVPAHTPAEQVLALEPEGVFLSNGPGDPAAVPGAAAQVEALLGRLPLFGICLGCQILALALGGKTYKLRFGHHAANHPVRDCETGRVEITSQNHGFAIDADSLPETVEVTHINLNDGTVEGIRDRSRDAFAVQYHPEAAPGPHDSRYLFERFTEAMQRRR
ncbi:MAG: carbamoyl-phosphate synthase small subunit [Deltaproteobacteria bacterium]|nr:MAG: carbamoyl-phosphate synthase small subunit [Deltaproteobacteria bacterium]